LKKVLILALCLVLAGILASNSTYALPDVNKAFQTLIDVLGEELGVPTHGGDAVKVTLLSSDEPQTLYPGGSVSRTMSVRNDGTDGAYFRFAIAVQYEEESWQHLDVQFEAEDYAVSGWMPITIADGTHFRMKVFTYDQLLAAGQTSPDIAMTIHMDRQMTSEQMTRYRSDFIQMKALAIGADAFSQKAPNALDALNLALPLDKFQPF